MHSFSSFKTDTIIRKNKREDEPIKLSTIAEETRLPINNASCEMPHYGETEIIYNSLDPVLTSSGGNTAPASGDIVVFLKSSIAPDRRQTGVVALKIVSDQPLGLVFGTKKMELILRYIETGHHVRGKVLDVTEVHVEPEVPGGEVLVGSVLKATVVYIAQCPKQMIRSNANEFVEPYLMNINAYLANKEHKDDEKDAKDEKDKKANKNVAAEVGADGGKDGGDVEK
ncbi:hypothetical protein BJ508DRAFT_326922 [Ascobolus immersus RN42]|uniref:Uncharacterized protein n=1 Tax=Ascobolus immersus RN42 TaxID=1160509 RepID=A0A3N4I854_ASCIM|nr:hypothetical protein BJ508DRAFT_326922 [Ascobolus immersus RN42]